MGLQVIFGTDQEEKKRYIIDNVLKNNPHAKIYYIVPDHMKFEMENFVIKTLQEKYQQSSLAVLNIQVVSFTRLAWYLMPHKMENNQNISEIGMNMILHQILKEHKSHLQILSKHSYHHGFVEKLQAIFHEFYQGQIDSSSLEEFIGDLALNTLEKEKLSEIRYLYDIFKEKIEGKSLLNYQLFQDMRNHLLQSDQVQHMSFIIDHHIYFSQLQYSLIEAMMRRAKNVWITLPFDKIPRISDKPQGMFSSSQRTYRLLMALAKEYQVKIQEPLYILDNPSQYAPDIYQAAQTIKKLLDYQYQELQEYTSVSSHHELWQCDSIQTELTRVSNQIYHLVHKEGYRYKDIAILVRDLDTYADLVPRYLAGNDIPYFIDHTQSMMSHVFSKWLNALFKLHLSRWKYQDLMAVLKLGLIIPKDIASHQEYLHQLSILENYILSHGYDRYRFYDKTFTWDDTEVSSPYQNYLGQRCEATTYDVLSQLRDWIIDTYYQPLSLIPSTFTGKFAANWLYETIINMGVKEALMQQRDAFVAGGDIHRSKHMEQIWQVFSNILEEFYTIYENHELNFEDFVYFINSGFKEATFHIIPPTLDQVTVTNIESPQVQAYQIIFALDLSYGNLPRHQQNESLISDNIRKQFQSYLLPYQSLQSTSQQNNSMEAYITYQLFKLAKSFIYLSYIPSQSDGNDGLSPYIKQWLRYEKIDMLTFRASDPFQVQHPSNVGSHRALYPMYIYEIGKYIRQSTPIPQHLQYMGKAMLDSDNDAFYQQFLQVLTQMFKHNPLPDRIQEETALSLYGQQLVSSVSKMEMYYQDPYSYFLVYGLKLQERESLELNSLTAGTVMHEVLDRTVKSMIKHGLTWKDISPGQFFKIQENAIDQVCKQNSLEILLSNSRQYFVVQHLIQHLREYSQHYLNIAKYQALKPLKSELIFGQRRDADISGKEFILGPQRTLNLTGKIDRIDQTLNEDMIQVIDYKSGNKGFSFVDFYYGLDLQIMTYYLLAKEALNIPKAIGGFYHSLRPEIKDGNQSDWLKLNSGESNLKNKDWNRPFTGNKYSGFMAIDSKGLMQVQDKIQDKELRSIYPVRIKKDGSYYSNTLYFDQTDMSYIETYLYNLYIKAGQEIQSGNIKLQPFKDDEFVLSKQKDYRVITGFDATNDYQNYRSKQINTKQVLTEIRNILDEEGR